MDGPPDCRPLVSTGYESHKSKKGGTSHLASRIDYQTGCKVQNLQSFLGRHACKLVNIIHRTKWLPGNRNYRTRKNRVFQRVLNRPSFCLARRCAWVSGRGVRCAGPHMVCRAIATQLRRDCFKHRFENASSIVAALLQASLGDAKSQSQSE